MASGCFQKVSAVSRECFLRAVVSVVVSNSFHSSAQTKRIEGPFWIEDIFLCAFKRAQGVLKIIILFPSLWCSCSCYHYRGLLWARKEWKILCQMHSSKVRIVISLPKEFPTPGNLPKNAKAPLSSQPPAGPGDTLLPVETYKGEIICKKQHGHPYWDPLIKHQDIQLSDTFQCGRG